MTFDYYLIVKDLVWLNFPKRREKEKDGEIDNDDKSNTQSHTTSQ